MYNIVWQFIYYILYNNDIIYIEILLYIVLCEHFISVAPIQIKQYELRNVSKQQDVDNDIRTRRECNYKRDVVIQAHDHHICSYLFTDTKYEMSVLCSCRR